MRNRSDVVTAFTYHRPSSRGLALHGHFGGEFQGLALDVFDRLPESANRTSALRALAQARMAVNLAIALDVSAPDNEAEDAPA